MRLIIGELANGSLRVSDRAPEMHAHLGKREHRQMSARPYIDLCLWVLNSRNRLLVIRLLHKLSEIRMFDANLQYKIQQKSRKGPTE